MQAGPQVHLRIRLLPAEPEGAVALPVHAGEPREELRLPPRAHGEAARPIPRPQHHRAPRLLQLQERAHQLLLGHEEVL